MAQKLTRCLLLLVLCIVQTASAQVGTLTVTVINNTGTNISWEVRRIAGASNLGWTPTGSSSQPTGTTVTESTANSTSGSYPKTVRVKLRDSSVYAEPDPAGVISAYGADTSITVTFGPTAPPQFWIRTTLYNFSSYWETNWIFRDEGDQPFVSEPIAVPPRSSGHPVVVGPFSEIFPWGIYSQSARENWPDSYFENLNTNAFSTHGPTSTNPPASYQSPNHALPGIGPGSPITTNWTFSTGDTNGARDSTLREGFSGLRSILEEGQATAHEDAKAIRDAIRGTNGPAVSHAEMTSQGTAAAASTKTSMEGAATALNRTMGAPGGDSTIAATLPGGYFFGGVTMNLGPTAVPALATLASWSRFAFLWVAVIMFIRECMSVCERYLAASTAARQASAAGTTVLGNNLNTPVALGMAGLITVALAAVPAAMVGITSSMSVGGQSLGSIVGANIFSAAGPVGTGLTWANQVFPLVEAATLSLMYLVFRFQVGAIYTVATTAVRFFVG